MISRTSEDTRTEDELPHTFSLYTTLHYTVILYTPFFLKKGVSSYLRIFITPCPAKHFSQNIPRDPIFRSSAAGRNKTPRKRGPLARPPAKRGANSLILFSFFRLSPLAERPFRQLVLCLIEPPRPSNRPAQPFESLPGRLIANDSQYGSRWSHGSSRG